VKVYRLGQQLRQLRHVGHDPTQFDPNQSSNLATVFQMTHCLLLPDHPMTTWIMKSETDDPDRALANVEDQRAKGYTAWIEDELGKAVDEELLRTNKAVPTNPSLRERLTGPFVLVSSIVAGVVVLYLIGLWVD
jgi:hypothetical protein